MKLFNLCLAYLIILMTEFEGSECFQPVTMIPCNPQLNRRASKNHIQQSIFKPKSSAIHHSSAANHQENEQYQTRSFNLKQIVDYCLANKFKVFVVVVLVIQNSALSITMRMSHLQKLTKNVNRAYIPSTAVVCCEMIKFLFCNFMIWINKSKPKPKPLSTNEASDNASDPIVWSQKRTLEQALLLALPSILYVAQNNLQYLATSALSAAVYQVLVQLKLISTAIFYTLFMNQSLSRRKWWGIILVTIGVMLVQLSASTSSTTTAVMLNLPVGLTAIALSCVTSAVAGLSTEKLLKNSRADLWKNNRILCFISMIFSSLFCLKDQARIASEGFFTGFSPLVVLVIFLQAFGGILVSLVVTETNSIVKGFTTAGSILVTSFLSIVLLRDFNCLNVQFLGGAMIVCLATGIYSLPDNKHQPNTIQIHPTPPSTPPSSSSSSSRIPESST
jgi:solute carrier family 35 (UDP-sugar transporter), member A1/2/3